MTHNLNQNLKIGGHLTFQPITFLSESPLFDAEILEAFEPSDLGHGIAKDLQLGENGFLLLSRPFVAWLVDELGRTFAIGL